MLIRLVYLLMVRLFGWLILLARSDVVGISSRRDLRRVLADLAPGD